MIRPIFGKRLPLARSFQKKKELEWKFQFLFNKATEREGFNLRISNP